MSPRRAWPRQCDERHLTTLQVRCERPAFWLDAGVRRVALRLEGEPKTLPLHNGLGATLERVSRRSMVTSRMHPTERLSPMPGTTLLLSHTD